MLEIKIQLQIENKKEHRDYITCCFAHHLLKLIHLRYKKHCCYTVDPKTRVFEGDFILFYLLLIFFKKQKGGREVILFLLFLKEGGTKIKKGRDFGKKKSKNRKI